MFHSILFHSIPFHSVLSHPIIPFHPIPSHHFPFRSVLYHSLPSHPILFYSIPFHPIPSHPSISYPIPFYSIPSHPVPFYPILTHPSLLSHPKPCHPIPTFCVVLVQLVGSFLPVLDPVLQRVDQALHQGTETGRNKKKRDGAMEEPGLSLAISCPRCRHLLGELPELGLDAAVPHAHAGQCRADVPRGPWGRAGPH